MADPSRRERGAWEQGPWGLLGMLVLVVLVERYISKNALRFLDNEDWSFRYAAQVASKEGKNAKILVVGDSQFKAGVLPRGIEERTGRKTLNLAMNGAQIEAGEALLRRALAAGARPDAVVFDAFPKMLQTSPRFNRTHWAGLLGYAEVADMAWAAADPDLFAMVALAKLLPSVRGRDALRDNVRAALDGRVDGRVWANSTLLRAWRKNAGAALMPPPAKGLSTADAELDLWFRGYFPSVRVDPVHARALEQLLTTAKTRGIAVYWVLPPQIPSLQARCEAKGYDAAHRALARSYQARFANLVVVDATRSARDPRAFYDPHHLSAEGAYPFSLTLGDLIRKSLATTGAARWAVLAEFSPRPLPDDVEDLHETVAALEKMNKVTATR
jgi:hypothetical protein